MVKEGSPARGVTGGEGGGVWEVHRTRVHLSMPGIEVGVGCSGSATRAGGRRRRELDGEVAPTGSGRGGGVGELCEVEAKLMEGLAWAEEGCSGRFMAVSSLPAFGQSACVLGCWRQGTGE